MDNYLKQYSCSNGFNNYNSSSNLARAHLNTSLDSKDEINIKELSISNTNLERAKSTLNVSRGVSCSSKKSIQEKREEFSKRVQKLKNQLDSTKNQHKGKMNFKSTNFAQTQGHFNNSNYRGVENYQADDGTLSPTNIKAGFTSYCGNYLINHSRSSTGLMGHKNPQIVISSQAEIPQISNFSYYSLNPGIKRVDRNSSEKRRVDQSQLDGTTLLVDRLNNYIKQHFNKIVMYAEEVHSLNNLSKQQLVSFAQNGVKSNQLAK